MGRSDDRAGGRPSHPFDVLRPKSREELFNFVSSLPASAEKSAILPSLLAFSADCVQCTERCRQRLSLYRSFLSSLDARDAALSPAAPPASAVSSAAAASAASFEGCNVVQESINEQIELWQDRCLAACARENRAHLSPASDL
ncbi:hypothetical protein BESB_004300 [Besnoitia besnoiti]|uniref:Uncharacterized protein n=1 Tax=Besnoitia besnoiti TaxID=94643 RepID=A0A2A9MJJ7_BESBE|nr:hypothetical protein BESB_004300 [Besnoitia besnoiti]PFH38089.1 hypothetical protein BESB_004300 [Besnoitia besnoiti]